MMRAAWMLICLSFGCGAEERLVPPVDGSAWPAARYLTSMAYDAGRGRVVLYGGGDDRFNDRGESYAFEATWEWDGEEWKRAADVGPTPRTHHAMVYDPSRGAIVLHGGLSEFTRPCYPRNRWCGDTWTWDGSSWTEISGAPVVRVAPAMVYDDGRSRLLLIHGVDNGACLGGSCQDLSTLTSSTWTNVIQ